MKGITAAFTGKLGNDAELRRSKAGKPWVPISVAVIDDTEATTWVRVALFGDMAKETAYRLKKGTEVYCEGSLSLTTWTGKDGTAHTGLSLAAWKVEPLGQIGQRRPKRPQSEASEDPVPFDDPVPF